MAMARMPICLVHVLPPVLPAAWDARSLSPRGDLGD